VSLNRDLVSLREHWGSAYWIAIQEGTWVAARRDKSGTFTATSAAELLRKIRENYRERPVPRDR
jgi:hypothetical protein